MRTDFRRALAAVEEYRNPSDRVSGIKRAVTNEIHSVDPSVHATFTDYYNHTAVPDIILQWPNGPERFLFVRSQGSADWLLRDLPFIAPHHPLIFTLDDLDTPPANLASGITRGSLEEAATAAGTWITDSSGTEAISSVRSRSVPLGLLGQALVRGGRGVSDSEEVTRLTVTTEAGFVGASDLSVDVTRSAVQAIESHLDANQAGRLTRLLRAVWEGHGGDAASFPTTATVGKLTSDDLSYLLNTTVEGPADFWRRIGRGITTELFGRVNVDDPSDNLQALVSGSLDFLQAKGLRLIEEPPRMFEPEQAPRWLVDRGCLALRGLNWTVFVAARSTEELPAAGESPVPDLKTLQSRAAQSPVPIIQVTLGKGDRALSYESKAGGNVLQDQDLDVAAADLRVTDIDEITLVLPGGGKPVVDFSRKMAAGYTNSMFPLGSLIRATVPLLTDIQPDEQTALRDFLATGQGELF